MVIEYRSVTSSNFFFAFQYFRDHISVEHDENPHTTNLTWIGSWWPEIWLHECLELTPLKSVYIGLVQNCLEPGQFTLISVGLIRYSCGHISGPPWTGSHQIWAVDVFHHAPRIHVFKTLKCKKFFVMSSLLFSILCLIWSWQWQCPGGTHIGKGYGDVTWSWPPFFRPVAAP